MCRHCQNSSLDQSISRAKFNVDALDTLPAAEEIELVVGVLSE